jgi:hypothetical protein
MKAVKDLMWEKGTGPRRKDQQRDNIDVLVVWFKYYPYFSLENATE